MRVVGVTFTFNEERLVPHVMEYWKRLGVDKLLVFDNMSTDRTVELLRQYDFVEVGTYGTDGHFDEFYLTYLRNNLWKGIYADYIIVSDFDEVPYCETDFKEFLSTTNATIIQTHQFNVVRKNLPEFNGELLHTFPETEFNDMGIRYDKCHTFSPKSIQEIGYALGMHTISPDGDVILLQYPEQFYFFHLKYFEDYTIEKATQYYDRLPYVIKQGGGINWHIKLLRDDYNNTLNKFVTPRYESLEELRKNLKR